MSIDKESSRTYYWNVVTREVSWFSPVDQKLGKVSSSLGQGRATNLAALLASRKPVIDSSDPRKAAARRRMAMLQTNIVKAEESLNTKLLSRSPTKMLLLKRGALPTAETSSRQSEVCVCVCVWLGVGVWVGRWVGG